MESTSEKTLFTSLRKQGIEFANRIVMAPMTRSRATGSVPNSLMASYYAQRASAGLIVTEGTAPSPNGLGYARIPGIYNEAQVDGWRKITKAVHEKGGKIFLQIMHTGRISHAANMPAGARIIAPSAVASNGDMWTDSLGMQKEPTPEAMSAEDIRITIEEFTQAARNAILAGFDGVELHAANGYLPEQFLNPHVNQRSDNYGGSKENRSRFAIEIASAMANAIGPEKVGVRVSPYSNFNHMDAYSDTFDTYKYLVDELSKINILYLHVVDYAARASEQGKKLLEVFRNNFSNLLILNGGYTKERAIQALQNKEADLISFGSTFLANPDLPLRLRNDIPLNHPDPNTFYTPGEAGYLDYAFAKTEVAV
jgi:N-ethylmaleimide reductase